MAGQLIHVGVREFREDLPSIWTPRARSRLPVMDRPLVTTSQPMAK